MQAPLESPASHQTWFHQRWNHLQDPHVRTLSWLIDAPNLLDAQAAEWVGRIASLGPADEDTFNWLSALDRTPQELHASLELNPYTRLGRYAEKLMAFYLQSRQRLFAHGVQVRSAQNETIGEFDFLLRNGDGLLHWEFATKLYLLESSGRGHQADYFVGPNLADTLGAKIRKIMERKLNLSRHPAALLQLPQPVTQAQALVKGWLFYPGRTPAPQQVAGVSASHCRGFWCAFEEIGQLNAEYYLPLQRLSWLAPAKAASQHGLDKAALQATLAEHFDNSTTPVLVALMQREGQDLLESDRGFIVPNDWHSRAEARLDHIA